MAIPKERTKYLTGDVDKKPLSTDIDSGSTDDASEMRVIGELTIMVKPMVLPTIG